MHLEEKTSTLKIIIRNIIHLRFAPNKTIYHEFLLNKNKERLSWQKKSIKLQGNAKKKTLIIDVNGNIHSYIEGEVSFEELEQKILDVSSYFPESKLIKRPRLTDYGADILEPRLEDLSFPGKIISDEISQRLFITDSNNNRILLTSLNGTITDEIGRGNSGFLDGDASSALFNNPQGIAHHEISSLLLILVITL